VAFATAFAAPFFVLALVPGLLKALPRSGGWLDSVKVVMGFLELAAALKFLRTAELRGVPDASTSPRRGARRVGGDQPRVRAVPAEPYRLPHDEENANISVPRLMFALLFLGLAMYLAPALSRAPTGSRSGRRGRCTRGWKRSSCRRGRRRARAQDELATTCRRVDARSGSRCSWTSPG
jgi:thiol:disulfide interchange protein DsbD